MSDGPTKRQRVQRMKADQLDRLSMEVVCLDVPEDVDPDEWDEAMGQLSRELYARALRMTPRRIQ